MSSGIDALKELFNVSEERKNYNMNIHFNIRDLEYNQIFDLRTKLVEVKLESIIKHFEYIPSSVPVPHWTEGYLTLMRQVLPVYEWRLRLVLDMNKMVAYKISMNKIIKMIKDKAPPNIIVVPSPITLGILDLYPKEDEIDKQFGQNSSLMFLSVSVLPIIQEFLLSGIEGIEGLFPTSIPILSIISEEIPVVEDDKDFYLSFSRSQMRKTGIGQSQLTKLFTLGGIKVVEEVSDEGMYVEMPESARTKKGYLSPTKYLRDILKEEEDKMDEEEKQMRLKQNKGYIPKASEFYQSSKCWIAETNGKNFLEVIKLPEVDPYYTYSNDFYETSSILGIEATRTLLMMELKNVLVREEYINMRHISLLVDVMTNLGRLTPISFYGAMRFGQGSLSLATNQQSMKVFTGSSAFGKKETVDSVSASVMLGKKAKIGTGFVEILSKNKVPVKSTHMNTENLEFENEDIAEQQNIETNQAYMDVMFNSYEGEIYGGRRIHQQKTREEKKEDIPMVHNPMVETSNLVPPSLPVPSLSAPSLSVPSLPVLPPSLPVPSLPVPSLPKKVVKPAEPTKPTGTRMSDIYERMKAKKLQMKEPEKIMEENKISETPISLDVLRDL
jgi:hypothetical protein